MNYEEFIDLHGHEPYWIRARADNEYHFEGDLRGALSGDQSGFCEIAIYGRPADDIPLLVRDLWRVGAAVRHSRRVIKDEWVITSHTFVRAFGDDLDAFLRDAGFGVGRLPEQFDVWRGGTEPAEVMAGARCWTIAYPAACAFALENELWRNARTEQLARERGEPEPLVVTRRVQREQVAAWMGGVEREVVLAASAFEIPAQPYGSLREWRRHSARRRNSFAR